NQIKSRQKDENFYWEETNMADYPRGYEGAPYGRRGDEDEDRYGRSGRWRGREERGFWDRDSDEARSWLGDEDADRRGTRDDRGYGRDYGRETYRPGSRGDYERGYGEYGRGYSEYGRESSRGDYERGYGGYGQSSYGQGGYGQPFYGGSRE